MEKYEAIEGRDGDKKLDSYEMVRDENMEK